MPLGGPSSALPATDGPTFASSLGAPVLAPRADEPSAAAAAGPTQLLGGLLGGLVAAILASAVWFGVVAVSGYQVGLVAIAVGFLVGHGVVLGARRHGSIVLVLLSAVLTLLALVTSEYLIVAYLLNQELAAEGLTIEVLQPPAFVIEIVVQSVQTDPLTLVFWAIALFQAIVIPLRLVRRPG